MIRSTLARAGTTAVAIAWGLALAAPHARAWERSGRIDVTDRPQFSNDGAYVAYTRYGDGACVTRRGAPVIAIASSTSGTERQPTIPTSKATWRAAWSPSASILAFFTQACERGAPVMLGLFDLRTGTLKEIAVPGLDAEAGLPRWLPDGTHVLVVAGPARGRVPEASSSSPSPAPRAIETRTPAGNGSALGPLLPGAASPTDGADGARATGTPTVSLVAVSIAGEPRIVARGVPGITGMLDVLPSPSGQWAAYRSAPRWNRENPARLRFVVDIGLIDLRSGRGQRLFEGTEIENGNEGQGLPANLAWHPTRDVLAAIHAGALWRWDPARAQQRVSIRTADQLHHHVLGFIGGGAHVLVGLGEVDWGCAGTPCTTPARIARVDLDSGAFDAQDLRGLGKYRGVFLSRAGTLLPQRSDRLVIQIEQMSTARLVSIEVSFGAAVQTRTLVDELGLLTLTDQRGRDGDLLAVRESLKQPQRLVRLSGPLEAARETLVYANPPNPWSRPLDVQVFSQQVPGYDRMPVDVRTAVIGQEGRLSADTPALLIAYPGQAFSSYARSFLDGSFAGAPVSRFLAAGYNLILVDLPMRPIGSGPANLLQEMRDLALPQVYAAAARGLVDGKRLGLCGFSSGAYLALGLSTQTQLFQAVIGLNGAGYDLASTFGMLDTDDWATRRYRLVDTPWSAPERYDDNSPYRLVERIQAPVFLTSGGQDLPDRVMAARMMFNALKYTGKQAYLVSYPYEGHPIPEWTAEDREDLWRRLSAFLQRHLAVDRSSSTTAAATQAPRLPD